MLIGRVRENQILMLHGSNKGCLAASPYVDAYGEPDPFLRYEKPCRELLKTEPFTSSFSSRRGNPLHLSQERMDQLLQHYLHHDVADEVSHQMDQNGALAGFDWFHF
jgi:E3 ubiquitin-protein ligase UBR2